MRSNLTGNLLGGALLADLLEFLDKAVTVISANVLPNIYYKLVHLSGHYNTQLGVLGALEIDQDPAAADVTWFRWAAEEMASGFGRRRVGWQYAEQHFGCLPTIAH